MHSPTGSLHIRTIEFLSCKYNKFYPYLQNVILHPTVECQKLYSTILATDFIFSLIVRSSRLGKNNIISDVSSTYGSHYQRHMIMSLIMAAV